MRRTHPPVTVAPTETTWTNRAYARGAVVAWDKTTWHAAAEIPAGADRPGVDPRWTPVAHGGANGVVTGPDLGAIYDVHAFDHSADDGADVPGELPASYESAEDGSLRSRGALQATIAGDVTIAQYPNEDGLTMRFPIARSDGTTVVGTLEGDGTFHVPASIGDLFWLNRVAYTPIRRGARDPGLYAFMPSAYAQDAAPVVLPDLVLGATFLRGHWTAPFFLATTLEVVADADTRMTVTAKLNEQGGTTPDPRPGRPPFVAGGTWTQPDDDGLLTIYGENEESSTGPTSADTRVYAPVEAVPGEWVFRITVAAADALPADLNTTPTTFTLADGAITFS